VEWGYVICVNELRMPRFLVACSAVVHDEREYKVWGETDSLRARLDVPAGRGGGDEMDTRQQPWDRELWWHPLAHALANTAVKFEGKRVSIGGVHKREWVGRR
jgi:hypothetical protein